MANQNLFNSIKLTRPNRNRFDLSHDVKMSLDMGRLYPTLALECIPGDKFRIGCDSLLRFAPLVSPVMHRMQVTMHYFFVPNRIVWPNWEKFITKQEVVVPPTLTYTDNSVGTLNDYLGLPQTAVARTVSAIPHAAYQMIYNEYYRDQNLIDPITFELTDGDNSANADLHPIRYRAWKHDYFTASLPFAQKGAAVEIPVIQDFADVPVSHNATPTGYQNTATYQINDIAGNPQVGQFASSTAEDAATDDPVFNAVPNALFAQTSSLTTDATTINDLRRAEKLQQFLEKLARGGSRYAEVNRSFFGVRSPDARLQRPEYFTGTVSPVIISEVLNNSGFIGTGPNTTGRPQGDMAGHGVAVTTGGYGTYYCQEHGYIIGIMSVLPEPAYQQGIPRHFLKQDAYEYFWPEFAHLGEQEVMMQEIYANATDPTAPFGYVPRYSEYKYHTSRVAGDFKSPSLAHWHLGRIFASEPALNQQFVECNPDTRIFAVEEEVQHLYAQVVHRIDASRLMPKFGTPSF